MNSLLREQLGKINKGTRWRKLVDHECDTCTNVATRVVLIPYMDDSDPMTRICFYCEECAFIHGGIPYDRDLKH